MATISSFLLRATVSGHRFTTPESTDAIGVLRPTRVIAARTALASVAAIRACIGAIATTVIPFAPSQNKSRDAS